MQAPMTTDVEPLMSKDWGLEEKATNINKFAVMAQNV